MKHLLVLTLLAALGCQTTTEQIDPPLPSKESAASAQANESPHLGEASLTLERIFSDPPLFERAPRSLRFSPNGKRLVYLRASENESEITDLWAMDLPNGAARPLVRTLDITKSIKLSEAERMQNERKRIGTRGITSYTFCGDDGQALLFPLSGDLYLVTLDKDPKKKPAVQKLTNDDEAELNPTCSKRRSFLTYVKKGDLYLYDFATERTKRITSDASDAITNGLAEFVAQEEMGRYKGAWISSDESTIAYLRVDESAVSQKTRSRIYAERTEMFTQRYPAAGEANAEVSLYLYDVKRGRKSAQSMVSDGGYIARVGFSGPRVYVQWQSRDQKTLQLHAATIANGVRKPLAFELLHEEKDDAWVELHDDLHFLKNEASFVWSSEYEGKKRLYKKSLGKSDALVPLSKSGGAISRLLGVDKDGRYYYEKRSPNEREQHVYSATSVSDEVRLTQEPGWHSARYSKGDYLVTTYSSVQTPHITRLITKKGEVVRQISGNLKPEYANTPKPKPKFIDAYAKDKTFIGATLYEPLNRVEGQQYPLIVYAYGGPSSRNTAANAFWSNTLWLTHLTQRGYGVLLVGTRGVQGSERQNSRAHHHAFGKVAVSDIKSALKSTLKSEAWIAQERIGFFGWSYGGYAALQIALDGDKNNLFSATVAVAPVSDWTLYDTHYTERYIGIPKENAAVYAASDLVKQAANLRKYKRDLLLIHGMADDNVLFENSLRMVSALQNDGALFEMMPYPGRAHSIRGKKTRLHLFRTITDFFDRKIGVVER